MIYILTIKNNVWLAAVMKPLLELRYFGNIKLACIATRDVLNFHIFWHSISIQTGGAHSASPLCG